MTLKVFNTWSRALEPFMPMDPAGKQVGMYCCGPTVHDFAHIGNFRTFVFADLARRYLEFRGYQVRHVLNVTDVEDKIIARVREAQTSLREYTAPFEQAFFEDLRILGCRMPHDSPHATEHLPEMILLIERLIERGLAYRAGDGSVYFSIEKYRSAGHRYGQLVKLNFDEMRPGARVAADEYAKEALADFALWKARMPEDGAVYWPSPWGEGRPGWHIECSAMSMKLLGPCFDLHLGGEDLMFPHHEDEIAQSEGAGLQPAGHRFVTYWLHVAHLLVEGKKMSKSLGNFYTLRELLSKGYTGREIRFLLLSAHYREPFNFTLEGLNGARTALARLDECAAKLSELASGAMPSGGPDLIEKLDWALAEDFNVSRAWGLVFEWVREVNRLLAVNQLTASLAATHFSAWQQMDAIFGIGAPTCASIPPEIHTLLEARQQARAAKDFTRADAVRGELKSKGWAVEDTPKGPRLKKI